MFYPKTNLVPQVKIKNIVNPQVKWEGIHITAMIMRLISDNRGGEYLKDQDKFSEARENDFTFLDS